MARIGIILGSTRPTRIRPVVDAWAQERLAALDAALSEALTQAPAAR